MKTLSRVLAAVAILLAAAVVWLTWVPSDAPDVGTSCRWGTVVSVGRNFVTVRDSTWHDTLVSIADWPRYAREGNATIKLHPAE